MKILVALEKFPSYRSQVWALEHPGLFCYGEDDRDALAHMPQSVLAYQAWLNRHDSDNWLKELGDFDISLAQSFVVYTIDENFETSSDGYEVNAWFRQDWKPPTRLEVERFQKLLTWSRLDLLQTVKGLSDTKLNQTYPNERWSIRGVLDHIANAEWWYLTRLDLTEVELRDLPENAFEKLAAVRQLTIEVLPKFEGLKTVLGKHGEFWSARKIIRRAVWHELDHVEHIRKLIEMP